MAKHNQKKAAEFKQFREWKKQRKKDKEVYERAEDLYADLFEKFKNKVTAGEITSFDQIEEPDFRLGTIRMVLDEMDGTLNIMKMIPSLRFKSEWDVRVLPNFMGSFSRFFINGEVSVYLDFYNRLGYYGAPYWEVYDGSTTTRFAFNDTVSMMDFIDETLKNKVSEPV